MTNRTFGVEIECGIGARWQFSHGDIERRLYTAGLGDWMVDRDGTEHEIRTPILQGVKGLNTLKKAMGLIVNLGGYVTHLDGMHVHHGAPEFINNLPAIQRLVNNWYDSQDVIEQMVAPRRRTGGPSHRNCPHWDSYLVGQINEGRPYGGDTRHSLNIRALARHQTIEIRLHEGTLDFDEAKAWILFGQKFIENALKGHTQIKPGSTDQLLKEIGLGYRNGAFLKEKARLGHTPSPATSPRLFKGKVMAA